MADGRGDGLVRVGQWRWSLLEDDALTATEQHVALVLAVRMNADGTIPSRYAPSTRTLAGDCGRRKDTVRAALARLASRGWLVKVREGSGVRPDEYRATLPSGAPTGPASGAPRGPTTSELVGLPEELVGLPEADSGAPRGPTTSRPAHTSTDDDEAATAADQLPDRIGATLDRTAVAAEIRGRLDDGWTTDDLLDHLTATYRNTDRREGVGNPTGYVLTLLRRCPDPPSTNGRPTHAAETWGRRMAGTLTPDEFNDALDARHGDADDPERQAARDAYDAARHEAERTSA